MPTMHDEKIDFEWMAEAFLDHHDYGIDDLYAWIPGLKTYIFEPKPHVWTELRAEVDQLSLAERAELINHADMQDKYVQRMLTASHVRTLNDKDAREVMLTLAHLSFLGLIFRKLERSGVIQSRRRATATV